MLSYKMVLSVILTLLFSVTVNASESDDLHSVSIVFKNDLSVLSIIEKAGLNSRDLNGFLNECVEGVKLLKVRPTDIFHINPMQFDYVRKKGGRTRFHKTSNGHYKCHEISTDVELVKGSVKSTFYQSAIAAGLAKKTVIELIQLLKDTAKFSKLAKRGDKFQVAIQKRPFNLIPVIIAASYSGHKGTSNIYRYEHTNGKISYFDSTGHGWEQRFLETPVEYTRISSPFDAHRKHPVHNIITPHRGVDLAAPAGSIVSAAGSGIVLESGHTKPNGNYIVIEHEGSIVTKYLHLKKRLVNKGDSLSFGQHIGEVGSTGYSSGPHLHFEFIVNGVHKDPMTYIRKYRIASEIPLYEKSRFKLLINKTQQIFADINTDKISSLIALNF